MVDAKYIKGKGLIACRDIKKDEMITVIFNDVYLWDEFINGAFKNAIENFKK